MSAKIEYNGSTVATLESGEKATLPVANLKMASNIEVTAIKDTPKLQIKTVTPTKENIDVLPDKNLNYEGLSKVTVAAIPAKYIDTTGATAVAGDILTGKTAYVNGVEIKGEMPNNSDYTQVLDASTTFVTLNGAYHEGEVYIDIKNPDKITENGTYTAAGETVMTQVVVDVQVPVWDGTDIRIETL